MVMNWGAFSWVPNYYEEIGLAVAFIDEIASVVSAAVGKGVLLPI